MPARRTSRSATCTTAPSCVIGASLSCSRTASAGGRGYDQRSASRAPSSACVNRAVTRSAGMSASMAAKSCGSHRESMFRPMLCSSPAASACSGSTPTGASNRAASPVRTACRCSATRAGPRPSFGPVRRRSPGAASASPCTCLRPRRTTAVVSSETRVTLADSALFASRMSSAAKPSSRAASRAIPAGVADASSQSATMRASAARLPRGTASLRSNKRSRASDRTPGSSAGSRRNRLAPLGSVEVQELLLDWYAESRRELPWRRTRDPYAILVSEVMAQQTQVDRVVPRWQQWLDRWPTVDGLAAASPADVIREWQGLGYNRRALNLHRAARQIAAHGWPADLTELPGVGRYTADAVACFAFGRDVLPEDVNVRRIVDRTGATFSSAAAQALMDLGATVCLARIPRCEICPLAEACPSRGRRYEPLRKQGPFEGSFRQRRSQALRAVVAGDQPSDAEAVAALARDGLVHVRDGLVSLPSSAP